MSGAPAGILRADAWRGFRGQHWQQTIDVRGFLLSNVTAYDGDAGFLTLPSARTVAARDLVSRILAQDVARVVPLVDASRAGGITSHAPGHLPEDLELLVGLQTDEPLRRAVHPATGLRPIDAATAGSPDGLAPALREIYTRHRRTVTDAVQDAWTPEMLRAVRAGLILGLPTAEGRGGVVGDYRRVPLYGVDRLIEAKLQEKHFLDALASTETIVRDRQELAAQVRALGELKELAAAYGIDIARPAATAHEAVQWLYLAYLGTIRESNGHLAPLGRTSSFLDIYVERDLAEGVLDEAAAQELFDDLVLRLRLVRRLRAAEARRQYGDDGVVITETVGGSAEDGRLLVTRSSLRMLQSLRNAGGGGQPTLAVLWSTALPDAFRRLAVDVALETGDVDFVSDDLVRPRFGDDASVVDGGRMVRTGKHLAFCGGEINVAKAVLYAISGGHDDMTGEQVAPARSPLDGPLVSPAELGAAVERIVDWLGETCVNAVDVVHYAHDVHAYEALAMALHDYGVLRTVATRLAGLATAADLLAAADSGLLRIEHDPTGRLTRLAVDGDPPTYGDGGPQGVHSARRLVDAIVAALRRHPSYRNAVHTLGIASSVTPAEHGRHTAATPNGRAAADPLAPGATPTRVVDAETAARAAAALPYEACLDGISLTVQPGRFGTSATERAERLATLLDEWGGCHLTLAAPHPRSGSVEA
jgi:formate C-acetyltransferase